VNVEQLPFYITAPGETDILFILVILFLILVVLGFGAFYFTVQSIPDRMVKGAGKAQIQMVSILGLLSLFTGNNAMWMAGLLLAAIRIPDIVTPLTRISRSLKKLAKRKN
jgi:phosphatidylglycerophosphate synthase